MPQFDMKGRGDMEGAYSISAGKNAEKNAGRSANEPTKRVKRMMEKNEAKREGKTIPPVPGSLNYFMKKAGGRKNAAYTMWKKHRAKSRNAGASSK